MIEFLAQGPASSGDLLEILKSVHVFYDDAWTKLVFTLSAVGGALALIIGVFVPWWLERSRRAVFKSSEEAVITRIEETKKEMQARIEAESKIYKENLQQALSQIETARKEAQMDLQDVAAQNWLIQAWTAHGRQAYGEAISISHLCIKAWSKGHGQKATISNALKMLLKVFSDKEQLARAELDAEDKKKLYNRLDKIERDLLDSEDKEQLDTLKKLVA